MYEGHGEAAHYYGAVTAADVQIGRLYNELEKLGVLENTAMFFCSDNGPETGRGRDFWDERYAGSTAGMKGRKRSHYEGGIRVPALARWPGQIEPGTIINTPASVLDYLPTLSAMTGAPLPKNRILDGENILPILQKEKDTHRTIPFRTRTWAWLVDGDYKLHIRSPIDNSEDELYDLSVDRAETTNIVKEHPEIAARMREEILKFDASAKRSHSGAEYSTPDYRPVDPWAEFKHPQPTRRKK